MEKPNLLERLGKGGMSVAWAVRWSPQDRDGAPAILKHHSCFRTQGALDAVERCSFSANGTRDSSARACRARPPFHSWFLYTQFLLSAKKEISIETDIRRERKRESPFLAP